MNGSVTFIKRRIIFAVISVAMMFLLVAWDKNSPSVTCPLCTIVPEEHMISCSFSFVDGIPESDDACVYLFEQAVYEENGCINEKNPLASLPKQETMTFTFVYKKAYLFSTFTPALKIDGVYVPLCDGQYITNPEVVAKNTEPYIQPDSKKGILLDPNTLDRRELTDLNVKRIVFNIPLSFIMGETEHEECPTIRYFYNGEYYCYNGFRLAGFDSLFSYLTEHGYHVTAIVLNDWNCDFPQMIHKKSRVRTKQSEYYAFNTEEAEGAKLLEATALFLADRYSGGPYGMIQDWIIANEINQQKIWNYMATDDLNYYVASFEKAFRIFYNAIKSSYANAHVYFSLDHDWNDNSGNAERFFNGRDVLYQFNACALRGGNYDWGLAIHPYPVPLPHTRFWEGIFRKEEDAGTLTLMNLSACTDILKKEEFRDTQGKVRSLSVSELGFSSYSGEKLQAAAFAYSFYIVDNNPFIDSYLWNRQCDDRESLKSGLALGLYNKDYSPKYIVDVFANIDSPAGEAYVPEMLEIIGKSDLKEALSAAR